MHICVGARIGIYEQIVETYYVNSNLDLVLTKTG